MKRWRKNFVIMVLAIASAGGGAYLAEAAANGADVPKVAFLGFELLNTSLEPTTPNERGRIDMLNDLFRQKLDHSGRFTIVPIAAPLQRQVAAAPKIGGCNGCERGFAKAAGGHWAAWGTVQKVSNLILNINVYMEDAATGKLEFVKSVDIRGNTDESWRHGLNYLLDNYLLDKP
jgi:hypothetical protein